MKIRGKEVTKEWYKCVPFEGILKSLWERNDLQWKTKFSKERLKREINSGAFGDSFVATFSPKSGSVQEIQERYRLRGKIWLDIENLCYHYSWQNSNGNYRSHKQLLEHLGGTGVDANYRLLDCVAELA